LHGFHRREPKRNEHYEIKQVAVFEAVNSIAGDYSSYPGTIAAPAGASLEAAAVAAAHRTLTTLFPSSAVALATARTNSLAAIPDGRSAWLRSDDHDEDDD